MRGMRGACLHQACPRPRQTAQAALAAALHRVSSTVFPKRWGQTHRGAAAAGLCPGRAGPRGDAAGEARGGAASGLRG